MPAARFKHVVSLSSEDPLQPAANLLKPETYHKWRCFSGAETQAVVCLQLDKACRISSIDIGNNGSAFVEILVGKSVWQAGEAFQVLLVASMLMTPSESKSGINLHAVRLFGPESLNKTTANEQWDQLKIICRQPYNKSSGYGLSFIVVHTKEEGILQNAAEETNTTNLEKKPIRKFALDCESKNDSMSLSGSFFKNRSVPSLSRCSEQSSVDVGSTGFIKRDFPIKNEASKKLERSPNIPSKRIAHHVEPANSKTSEESCEVSRKALRVTVNEAKILAGVRFAISGYKNPVRSDIRKLAVLMGASYEKDWNADCSHLICAFSNTPKFKQVAGEAKVVNKAWIDECWKHKKRLPTKRFRLNEVERNRRGSSSSDCDQTSRPSNAAARDLNPCTASDINAFNLDSNTETYSAPSLRRRQTLRSPEVISPVSQGQFDGGPTKDTRERSNIVASGCRVSGDIYRTESNGVCPDTSGLLLPDFFEHAVFFVYGFVHPSEERLLNRCIAAYGGKRQSLMNADVNYLITNENWNHAFTEISVQFPHVTFLRPGWIFESHRNQSIADTSSFAVRGQSSDFN